MYLLWKKDNTAQKNNSGALTAVRDTPCPHAFILSGKADLYAQEHFFSPQKSVLFWGASEQVGARDIIKTVIFTGAKGAMMCQVWGGHFKLTPQNPSLKGQKNPSDFEKKTVLPTPKQKKYRFFILKENMLNFGLGFLGSQNKKNLVVVSHIFYFHPEPWGR